ncbi:non-canonical ubiquitin conjugating enzyme 1 [Pholiota molesta]|nr:non-canonical ubiquitin conjugating enzyme 1 [Pholiota molesta]
MALNKNNSAVKRIMQEARELANDPCTDYSAAPLEDDIFEWHCTLRGSGGTEFEGGLYHFRILLPAEYPFRPPSIMILTPNGRFELNTKICISFTSYHEELWQPAWGVRTAIIGLQGFFPLKGQAAVGVGSIEYPASERKRLAALSREWVCPHCKQSNLELLPDPPTQEHPVTPSATEEKQITPAQSDTPENVYAVPTSTSLTETTGSGNAINTLPNNGSLSPVAQASDADIKSATGIPLEPLDVREKLVTQEQSPMTLSATSSAHTLDTESSTHLFSPNSPLSRPTPTTPSPTPITQEVRISSQRSQKPPVLLDGAICILIVLLFAIVCRRMV